MKARDSYGSVITIIQTEAGKIVIPFGDDFFTLCKKDAIKINFSDIENFNEELFKKAYARG